MGSNNFLWIISHKTCSESWSLYRPIFINFNSIVLHIHWNGLVPFSILPLLQSLPRLIRPQNGFVLISFLFLLCIHPKVHLFIEVAETCFWAVAVGIFVSGQEQHCSLKHETSSQEVISEKVLTPLFLCDLQWATFGVTHFLSVYQPTNLCR